MRNSELISRQEQLAVDAEGFADQMWSGPRGRLPDVRRSPIQKAQSAYYEDKRPHKISVAQGMVCNDRTRVRIYHPGSNSWFNSAQEVAQAGVELDECRIFENVPGQTYYPPPVQIAQERAVRRVGTEHFEEGKSPKAYGNPIDPKLLEVYRYDLSELYGDSLGDDVHLFSSRPTYGMVSGYDKTVPLINSARKKLGLPPLETVFIGTNSYGPWRKAFEDLQIETYRHTNDHGEFDLAAFKAAVDTADPATSLFAFDADTARNPEGVNRTEEDDIEIADILVRRKLLSTHDIAYPILDDDFDIDFQLIRILNAANIPHHVQHSRGKIDGTYSDRVAFSHFRLGNEQDAKQLQAHQDAIVRANFLSMATDWRYLFEFVADEKLHDARLEDLRVFSTIVNDDRRLLAQHMGSEHRWILDRSGMFSIFRISHKGVKALREEDAVYGVKFWDENPTLQGKPATEVMRLKHGGTIPDEVPRLAAALQDKLRRFSSS